MTTSKKTTSAKKTSKKTVATESPTDSKVIPGADITFINDAMAFLKDNPNITATSARLILANVCGRTSPAHITMQSLKTDFEAAEPRSAEKTAIRARIMDLKADMDILRAKLRNVIDTAALDYQNKAAQNKAQAVQGSLENKRQRFLKVRAWLKENDADWLKDNS